jgi:hypothetical protein
MKIKNFLLVLIFALTPAMWAQDGPPQAASGRGSGNQMRAEHLQKMMAMHKQESNTCDKGRLSGYNPIAAMPSA